MCIFWSCLVVLPTGVALFVSSLAGHGPSEHTDESEPSPSQLKTSEAKVKVIACLLCMFAHSRSGIVYTSTCSIRYSIYLHMQYQV